jgi:hypothetical protein
MYDLIDVQQSRDLKPAPGKKDNMNPSVLLLRTGCKWFQLGSIGFSGSGAT